MISMSPADLIMEEEPKPKQIMKYRLSDIEPGDFPLSDLKSLSELAYQEVKRIGIRSCKKLFSAAYASENQPNNLSEVFINWMKELGTNPEDLLKELEGMLSPEFVQKTKDYDAKLEPWYNCCGHKVPRVHTGVDSNE